MPVRHLPSGRWRAVASRARTLLAALAIAACRSDKSLAPRPTPASLLFTTSPAVATAGGVITPAIQVAILDASGVTVTDATNSVTITLSVNPVGGRLSGTTTVNAVNGVATFTDLSVDKASSGYALAASSGGIPFTTSPYFTVNPGSPAKLTFTAQPSTAASGAMIPAVQVAIQDSFGNTVTDATNPVTVVLGVNPVGATLSGTTTVNAISGVATFANLSIDKTGAGFALAASLGALSTVISASFNITAPPIPAKVVFTVPPGAATVGTAISPAVRVAIQDVAGNTATTATNPVTLTLATNPAGATLSGTLTVNAVSGVATFGDLSIDKASAGYVLKATSGSLADGSSPAFTVSPGAPSLHVTTATTGTNFPSSYSLSVDCYSDSYSYGYTCAYSSTIGVNDAANIMVAAGNHSVELGVPSNCAVTGGSTRAVTATGPTNVPFVVVCAGLGSVNVTTTTTGSDPTPDGYLVCVDQSGNSCFWHSPARPTDAISISGILAGSHSVSLSGVGGNCTVTGGPSHPVTIQANTSVSAPFNISCLPTERIAFSTSSGISMIHSDGSALHFITAGAAPSWSPDGSKLAYECGGDICAVNADGTGTTRVTSNGATNRHPTWSPDGLRIAFASSPGGSLELYTVAATGGAPLRLTNGVGFVGSAAWSPDGTQIAFDCQVDPGNYDICAVQADGTGFKRLTNDPARDYGAAWKPDGSALAFSTSRFGLEDEIALLSTADGSVTRLAGGLLGFTPTWSPDGSQLAFVQLYNDPEAGPYEAITTSRSDGSNVQLVTRGAQPAWRPHR